MRWLSLRVLFAPLACGVAITASAQVRYKVYDSGVNFNPNRIGNGGLMAGDSEPSCAFSISGGLLTIPPFPSRDYTEVEDVNRWGNVVGKGEKAGSGTVAFVWDRVNGTREVADFGTVQSGAYGISELGMITGALLDYNQNMAWAFVWRPDGSWITLPPKYGGWCGGRRINNKGEVLGYSQIGQDSNTNVLWRPDGSIVDLGNYPGQDQTFAFDLNNRGYVGGAATGNLGTIGYIWAPNGTYTGIFNPYGSGYLDVTGLNDTGYAIGSLIHPTLGWKGYIRYPNGTIKLLNDLLDASSQGWDVREAWDINNTGQISAAGYKNGQRRGLLLQPVLGPPVFSPAGPPLKG